VVGEAAIREDHKSRARVTATRSIKAPDAGRVKGARKGLLPLFVLPAIAECDQLIALPYGKWHERKAGDLLSPEREPMQILEGLKQMLGASDFSAQYQQSPLPLGGAMIKRDWVKRYVALPVDRTSMRILQSWDTASKGGPENDWSVCTTWQVRGATYHLIDVHRARYNYPDLKRKVVKLAVKYRADQVLVEDAAPRWHLFPNCKVRFADSQASSRIEISRPVCRSPPQSSRPARSFCRSAQNGSPISNPSCSPSQAADTTIRSIRSVRRLTTTVAR
jgi:hypothetical protein